jgi:nicotinamidase-related amidase
MDPGLVTLLATLSLIGVILGPATASAQDDAIPVIPDPVPVELDAATTAYLVLDMTEATCAPRPTCIASVPAAADLLSRARSSDVLVVYSTGRAPTAVLPGLAPLGDEPFVATAADKFYSTDLDDVLRSHGINTLVLVGTVANGAVLYTTFGGNLRGYTVVVAEDGLSGARPFDVTLTRYQVLNQAGFANPQNTPLTAERATLSRSDLITFR